jgi:hypothetical protein
VGNESDIETYHVEKSVDGSNFSIAGNVKAVNKRAGTYNWDDLDPSSGNNYYRICSISKDGQLSYSTIVKVRIAQAAGNILIFPNPVENGAIHIRFKQQPPGKYALRLINSLGEVVATKKINHHQGNSEETLNLHLAKGIYQLEIKEPDGRVEVMKVVY